MKKFDFRRGMWDTSVLRMTYTPMCKDYTEIRQEEDAIANAFNEKIDDFDYIGLAMTEPVTGDCTVSARCSFVSYGAPLIVLSDEVRTDGEGRRRYGAFYEIVSYHAGCNVWRVVPDRPEPAVPGRSYSVFNVTRQYFPVPEGTAFEISVRVRGQSAEITVNGNAFFVDLSDLPETYYVGITACEGLDRFYELTVDGEIGKEETA